MADPISPPELLDTNPHLAEFMAFLPEFNQETARGSALLACSMMDVQLEAVLRAFLIDDKPAAALLDGFNAPLGTFQAKIAAAAAMGLITDDEYREIEIIRRIRNQFAHGLGVTFDTQKVSALAHNLKMSIADVSGTPPTMPVSARNRFITAAVTVIIRLTNRAHYVGRERLQPKLWQF